MSKMFKQAIDAHVTKLEAALHNVGGGTAERERWERRLRTEKDEDVRVLIEARLAQLERAAATPQSAYAAYAEQAQALLAQLKLVQATVNAIPIYADARGLHGRKPNVVPKPAAPIPKRGVLRRPKPR